jgi:hypothetical protein
MSLSQDGYSFENAKSTVLTDVQPDQLRIAEGVAWGVIGVAHNIDRPKGELIECEITLSGYSDCTSIDAAIKAIKARRGLLTGTLTQTTVNGNRTYTNATFKEAREIRSPWAGGVGGTWVARMQLQWLLTGT